MPQEWCGSGSGDNSNTVGKVKRTSSIYHTRDEQLSGVKRGTECMCRNTGTPIRRTLRRCRKPKSDLQNNILNSPKLPGLLPHKVTLEDYQSACDEVLPWYGLSFIIAACTVPYRCVWRQA